MATFASVNAGDVAHDAALCTVEGRDAALGDALQVITQGANASVQVLGRISDGVNPGF